MEFYFREGLTWSAISSSDLSMRFSPAGAISETKGAMAFAESRTVAMECLALTNTSLVNSVMGILSPTLDYHEGPMGNLPATLPDESFGVEGLSTNCISLSRADWDSLETSWDFKCSPLL